MSQDSESPKLAVLKYARAKREKRSPLLDVYASVFIATTVLGVSLMGYFGFFAMSWSGILLGVLCVAVIPIIPVLGIVFIVGMRKLWK